MELNFLLNTEAKQLVKSIDSSWSSHQKMEFVNAILDTIEDQAIIADGIFTDRCRACLSKLNGGRCYCTRDD
jgi:hypothetical protein